MHVTSIISVMINLLLAGMVVSVLVVNLATHGWRRPLYIALSLTVIVVMCYFAAVPMMHLNRGATRTACEPTTHSMIWMEVEQVWKCTSKMG